ncbi:MAG: exopolysaccharide biosynthesis polyprenyl glycosylphosphotransferase [Acidimicrobiia bacterium]
MVRAARALLVLGTVAAVIGLGQLHASLHDEPYTGWFRYGWAAVYIVVLCVSAYGAGLPTTVRGRNPTIAAFAAVIAAAIAAAITVSVLQLLAGSALLPRFVVFGAPIVLVPWYVGCATLAWRGKAGAQERDRVVLVARADDAEAVRHDLSREPERDAQLVAAVTAEEVRSADTGKPLVELAAATDATVVVLAQAAQADDSIVTQAADLHEAGVRIRTLSGFCEEWLGKLPISELERLALMFDIGDVHRQSYARIKRVLDVIVSLLGLVALTILIPVVLVGNLVANRGPLFFRQSRVGQNGARFDIIKFRTMRAGVSGSEGEWTTRDDPRITPFGQVLRRTHLDELPQMLNVLRGDLTLVGPRPEQPRYVIELTEKIPFYDLRHLVRPGITGWAQIKYPYGSNEGDALEKLQYEFFYLRNQSLALDLQVIRRTLRHVFRLGGL